MSNNTNIVAAKGRPFSTAPMGDYVFLVEDDGTVLVFDDVAEHFTSCHAMTAGQMRRIRTLAKRPISERDGHYVALEANIAARFQ